MTDPTSLIDHARYSLAEPSSSKTVALIERCRAERAVCVVEGLLTPESMAALVAAMLLKRRTSTRIAASPRL